MALFRKYRLYVAAFVLAAGVGLLVWAVDHGQLKGWVKILCTAVWLSSFVLIIERGSRSEVLRFSVLCAWCSAISGFHWAEHQSSFPTIFWGVNALIYGESAVEAYHASRKSRIAAGGSSHTSGELNSAGNS